MVNETENTSQILGMCRFKFRFRLAYCGTITPVIRCGFSPNFARYSDMVSSRNVIDSTSSVSETINRQSISDFRGVEIRILSDETENRNRLDIL